MWLISLQWLMNSLIKYLPVVLLDVQKNLLLKGNYAKLIISWRVINQLLWNLKNKKYKDNILGAALTDMQLRISKYKNNNFDFYCVIDIYSKYVWVAPLKDKKGIRIISALQRVLNESRHKSNKIRVDKCSDFYNRSKKLRCYKIMILKCIQQTMKENLLLLKDWLEPYRKKMQRCVAPISKYVYINTLADIVNECNNTDQSKIKMKPVDIKSSTYIDFCDL